MDHTRPSKRLKTDATESISSTAYQGYRFPDTTNSPPQIERIDWQDPAVNSTTFFEQFVSKRKPCVIQNFPFPYAKSSMIQELQNMDTKVQVEQRLSDTEPFGQSRSKDRQITMSVAEFLKKKSPMHYLSTQEPPVDSISENDDQEAKQSNETYIPPPFFGPPCNQLQRLPSTLACAGKLRLASCHLWMGYANKAHSGLHHDFHDNFYVLLAGRKQFRLYSPADAPFMGLQGENPKVLFNGLISYPDNPSRPDGIPIPPSEKGELDDWEEGSEPPCIIGKGFDYKSDDEEAEFEEGRDDFGDGSDNDEQSDTSDNPEQTNEPDKRLPNHFSWIDPTAARDRIDATYRLFQRATECSLNLGSSVPTPNFQNHSGAAGVAAESGSVIQPVHPTVLYLPASWFHCVTSIQRGADDIHMAVNYWYYPPDRLNECEHPYQDKSFWE